jgi:hypothetical protein
LLALPSFHPQAGWMESLPEDEPLLSLLPFHLSPPAPTLMAELCGERLLQDVLVAGYPCSHSPAFLMTERLVR